MGPLIIFDKSALQCLNLDESVWLENFYLTNITPIFYIETLADLSKEHKDGRVSEDVVRNLADKTPRRGAYPNANHLDLFVHDLLEEPVPMDGRCVVPQSDTRILPDGKIVAHYGVSPEEEAMNSWGEGEFQKVEEEFAVKWREALANKDMEPKLELVKEIIPAGHRFADLDEVKVFVDDFVKVKAWNNLEVILDIVGLSSEGKKAVVRRYKKEGYQLLDEFAPYAMFVGRIKLFYLIGLLSSLFGERASDEIDISYLYYLPFCHVFTSGDKLHERTARLFMEQGQTFVNSSDLKKSLGELDKYYDALPEEVKSQGVIKFAASPPKSMENLTVALWDKYLPKWREIEDKEELPEDESRAIAKDIGQLEERSRPYSGDISLDAVNGLSFSHKVPIRKGKWYILPKDLQ